MRHAFDIYRRLLGVQIRSQLQYRVSFSFDLLSAMLVTATEFAALALVFGRFEQIRGWSLGEVAFLFGLLEISFGIMDMVFSGFDPQDFGASVRQGTFDQVMLRPAYLTIQVLGSQFALRRLGRVVFGAGIFLFAVTVTQLDWTPAKALYLPLVIAGMVLFFGGLYIVGSTITFWTVESIEAINILTYGGSYLISYPMHIYQNWLRRIFTYLVPAIFLNYYPALYFLGKPDPFGFPAFAPFLSPLVGVAMFLAALAFWRFGVRHYQSTGS
jgi:ABC-2 type transport system permease protein